MFNVQKGSGLTAITRARFYSERKKAPKTRLALKIALSLLVPYTGYAAYVFGVTNYEITQREKSLKDKDDLSFESTSVKYSTLKVLGRYENPFNEYRIQTIYEFFFNRIVEFFEKNRGGLPTSKKDMDALMPVHTPTWAKPENIKYLQNSTAFEVEFKPFSKEKSVVGNQPVKQLCFTWLGQSCGIVLLDSIKILTDPLFSKFLLNPQFGPRRITDMPSKLEDVPTPDLILLSHNHPDHIDEQSMNFWGDSHPNKPLWIIPKGLSTYMLKNNVSNFIELSWWETVHLKVKTPEEEIIYQISSTPAMHWSGRGVLDANRSLWCSFMIHKGNKPVLFHAGDTGFVHDLYKRIAETYGSNVTLALLPCGQYCPEWHQRPRHISPEEVIKIMKDLKADHALGVHWGTFLLSGEYFREPKEKLEFIAEMNELGERCYCPELGQTIDFSDAES